MPARALIAAVLIALIPALPAQAEPPAEQTRIRLALAALQNIQEDLFFIGYQTAGVNGETYMLLDFRYEGQPPAENELYASIDRICRTVLTNTRLVQDLSNAGYDMVSVAFDERSQYDCLPH